MSKITCSVSNCLYNKTYGCTANNVTVDGQQAKSSQNTCCSTFSQQHPGVLSLTKDIKSQSIINCSADNCLYNQGQKCHAADVVVNGKNADCCDATCCSTFRCK